MRGTTGGGGARGGGGRGMQMQARTTATAAAALAALLPLLLLVLALAPIAPAHAQTTTTTTAATSSQPLGLWAQKLGGQHGDDTLKAVATDAQGATYVAGDFRSGAINIGSKRLTNSFATKTDVFVVRGGCAMACGGSGARASLDPLDPPPSLTSPTPQAKFDRNGEVLWAFSYGGNEDDTVTDVVLDAAGNFTYLIGSFKSPRMVFGPGVTVQNGAAGGGEGGFSMGDDDDDDPYADGGCLFWFAMLRG